MCDHAGLLTAPPRRAPLLLSLPSRSIVASSLVSSPRVEHNEAGTLQVDMWERRHRLLETSAGKEVMMASPAPSWSASSSFTCWATSRSMRANRTSTPMPRISASSVSHLDARAVLWTARLSLLVAVVLHIVAAHSSSRRAPRPLRPLGVDSADVGGPDDGVDEGDDHALPDLLGLHLNHGAWSILHHLGWSARANCCYRALAVAVATAVAVGDISIPIAVLAGWIQ